MYNMKLEGLVPPDEKWKRMKAVWDSCKAADVDVPEEVVEFFNGKPPDPEGVTLPLFPSYQHDAVEKFEDLVDGVGWLVVDLKELPDHVKRVRFTVSINQRT